MYEIIWKENISQPAEILNRLRLKVIESLRQNSGTDVTDGMDMAVLSIDLFNYKGEFAGAKNPMYLVRKDKISEIDCDRYPVSIYDIMDPFTNHVFDIEKGDQIYLFSDGFADQFGGPDGKKFNYKNFKQLIIDHSDKPMSDQEIILEKTFTKWQGDEEQIDDVLLIGIKI